MSTLQSTCLLCQFRLGYKTRQALHSTTWQPSRSMMQAQHQRRTPSRMRLSPSVAKPTTETTPSGKPRTRSRNSPFGGMNLRTAQMTREPDRPSRSQQLRTSRKYGKLEKEDRKTPETFKALKMQRSLSAVPYRERSQVKDRIAGVDSFRQFALLPSVQEAVVHQALPGLESHTPTPIQRLSIPAFLNQDLAGKRSKRTLAPTDGMQQFLIAAETGSGKTLAYLLPILDAIKRAEAKDPELAAYEASQKASTAPLINPITLQPPEANPPHPTAARPRAIILLPTSELVTQVGLLAKRLSHTVRFRSNMISSIYSRRVIHNRLLAPTGIDLLVSTPHLLSSIAESDPNIFSRVSHLVIDEADSLLDRSFVHTTSAILDRATPSLKQLILCSATIPRSLDSFLRKRFPNMTRLATPNLHAIPRRVQLSVVDVDKEPYRGNKNLACADTVWNIGKAAAEHTASHRPANAPGEEAEPPTKNILVFVNEREAAVDVAAYLSSKGIDAVPLNRDTTERQQTEVLAPFTTTPGAAFTQKVKENLSKPADSLDATALTDIKRRFAAPEEDPRTVSPAQLQGKYVPVGRRVPPHLQSSASGAPPPKKRTLPNVKVLVATDLGSRGIDTVAVRDVILYDVPHTTVDFIHRLGRTGRMGRRGKGYVLVGRGDRRDVVREVREGMFRGEALI